MSDEQFSLLDDSDYRRIAEEFAEEAKEPDEHLPSEEQAGSLGGSDYREIAEALAEEKKVEAEQEHAAAVLPSLEKVIRSSTEEIKEEIKSTFKHFPFAGVEVLGNFEGFVLIEIADGRGNLIPPSEKRSYVLSGEQTYQLRVTIQSKEPMEGIFDSIRLTDGQDVESVNFTVRLDCDTLEFEPDELGFTVRTQETGTTTETSYMVAEEGIHTLFIQVYQKSVLVQVIRLEIQKP